MSWTILAIAGLGGGVGLFFKAPAILAASIGVAAVSGIASHRAGEAPVQVAVGILIDLAVLQTAYLLGLTASLLVRSRS